MRECALTRATSLDPPARSFLKGLANNPSSAAVIKDGAQDGQAVAAASGMQWQDSERVLCLLADDPTVSTLG